MLGLTGSGPSGGRGAARWLRCPLFIPVNVGMFEDRKFPFPDLDVQRRLVAELNELSEASESLQNIYQRKLAALDELKKSLLHRAFSGQL